MTNTWPGSTALRVAPNDVAPFPVGIPAASASPIHAALPLRIGAAPLARLADDALARLRRQSHFARPLSAGRSKSHQIEEWLQTAVKCICALAQPVVVHQTLCVTTVADRVILPDGTELLDPSAAETVRHGGLLSLYLFSLGFDQAAAFDWLGGDYMAHHVQNELSRETLFALGREARRNGWDGAPADARIRRIAVRVDAKPGQSRPWDVARLQRLLSLTGDAPHGVTMNESGCFQPLHSILGLLLSEETELSSAGRFHGVGG